jgi:hypothetical protein
MRSLDFIVILLFSNGLECDEILVAIIMNLRKILRPFIENGEERKGLKHLSWTNNERFMEMELKLEGEKRNNKVETNKGEVEEINKSKKIKKKLGKLVIKR